MSAQDRGPPTAKWAHFIPGHAVDQGRCPCLGKGRKQATVLLFHFCSAMKQSCVEARAILEFLVMVLGTQLPLVNRAFFALADEN